MESQLLRVAVLGHGGDMSRLVNQASEKESPLEFPQEWDFIPLVEELGGEDQERTELEKEPAGRQYG